MSCKTANYKCLTVRENTTIKKNKFSCIMFDNVGTQDLFVNGLLVKPDTSIEFNEEDHIFINTDFNVVFGTDGTKVNQVNVIETFYKDSECE